jgi:hypothetical protein
MPAIEWRGVSGPALELLLLVRSNTETRLTCRSIVSCDDEADVRS